MELQLASTPAPTNVTFIRFFRQKCVLINFGALDSRKFRLAEANHQINIDISSTIKFNASAKSPMRCVNMYLVVPAKRYQRVNNNPMQPKRANKKSRIADGIDSFIDGSQRFSTQLHSKQWSQQKLAIKINCSKGPVLFIHRLKLPAIYMKNDEDTLRPSRYLN